MTGFLKAYKKTGNSVSAYMDVFDCSNLPIDKIVDGSFACLENVFDQVDYFVSNETKMGLLKNAGKLLGGAVSLGGSYILELHSKHYADMYEAIYNPNFSKIKSLEIEINENLLEIGRQLTKLNDLIKPIRGALRNGLELKSKDQELLLKIDDFTAGFNSSLNIGFGGLVGGTTALGAWGLVSLIGSASTGTAISSLSGVAATNATLAWFGGGSLATGGAGMAGGFWVLGGIVAAPIVFFSTKNAYKKVDSIKLRKIELINEVEKLITVQKQASVHLLEVRKQNFNMSELMAEYVPKIEFELNMYRHHRSFLKDFFGFKMNEEQEMHLNKVRDLTNDLLGKIGFG